MKTKRTRKRKFRKCPWCNGKACEPGKPHIIACGSDLDVCHASGLLIDERDWQNAYCWKRISCLESQLAAEKELRERYEKALIEIEQKSNSCWEGQCGEIALEALKP